MIAVLIVIVVVAWAIFTLCAFAPPPIDLETAATGGTPAVPVRRPFVCPDCGAESHNPSDLLFGYCGRCRAVTGRPAGLDVPVPGREAS